MLGARINPSSCSGEHSGLLPDTSPVLIPASHGHLEALLREPTVPPRGAAVMCHPHPNYGGTMHTKAVYRGAEALSDVGFAALRFNFRGVGVTMEASVRKMTFLMHSIGYKANIPDYH